MTRKKHAIMPMPLLKTGNARNATAICCTCQINAVPCWPIAPYFMPNRDMRKNASIVIMIWYILKEVWSCSARPARCHTRPKGLDSFKSVFRKFVSALKHQITERNETHEANIVVSHHRFAGRRSDCIYSHGPAAQFCQGHGIP